MLLLVLVLLHRSRDEIQTIVNYVVMSFLGIPQVIKSKNSIHIGVKWECLYFQVSSGEWGGRWPILSRPFFPLSLFIPPPSHLSSHRIPPLKGLLSEVPLTRLPTSPKK